MAPTERVDSILLHPALAGRTLVVRRRGTWTAFEIERGGQLVSGRMFDGDPTADAWRGSAPR
jgi:hypothetical protein